MLATPSSSRTYTRVRVFFSDIYLATAAFRDPHTQREAECLGELHRSLSPPVGDEQGEYCFFLSLRDL